MSSAIDLHVAKAIAELAIFLEFTSPDLLNEDASVEAMEQLAAELQLMPKIEQRKMSECFRSLAASYDPEKREFVETLAESLGLAS